MSHQINVVLDTNVLVSALLSAAGLSAAIYRMIGNGKLVPHYNDVIMHEYREVLNRPKFDIHPLEINVLTLLFEQRGCKLTPDKSDIFLPHEADRIFYDTARCTESILITGNTRHFPHSAPFVMTPRRFVDSYGETI